MNQVDPFFFYSKSFPRILNDLKATLIYSTYQAGKIIMISSQNGESIVKYAKNFRRPMGIAISSDSQKIAIASKSEIGVFTSNAVLSKNYPERKGYYSHLYLPQTKYHTGLVDTHEIAWTKDGLLSTNTLFSCISKMSDHYHFEATWKPPFISDIVPEDRCHLNGMTLLNGQPKYVTMFASTDQNKGWRSLEYDNGLIMDVETSQVLLDKLPMPHSPILYEDKIYFLLSATGEVMAYDLKTKTLTKLNEFKSFVRGMEIIDDYIFLGMSKIREDSQFFSDLPISAEESTCGIRILNRHTGKEEGGLTYHDKIEEIFAVKIAKGVTNPGILTERDKHYDKCLSIANNQNYWLKENTKEKPIYN